MRNETLEALKLVYCEMLREPQGEWRITNQGLYCDVRDAIADASGMPPMSVQDMMEWFVQEAASHD